MGKYTCQQCGVEFTSYNPTPKFCSRACKNKAQIAPVPVETVIALYESGMSQLEVAEALGTTQKVIHGLLRRVAYRSRPAIKRDQLREKNSSWKGGRVLSSNPSRVTRFSSGGYWYIRLPDHPNAKKTGYVAEHVLIASRKLGRPLVPGEVVHHLDMNKHNNAPENLVVCDVKQHREYHLQLEMLAVQLFREGKIAFSPESGYFIAEEGDAE